MKRLISILLTITILFSITITASAENKKCVFTDIEDIRQTINKIYDKNFDEFQSLACKLRSSIDPNDEYFTYKANCGPCSTAFQKILYDNGITVENQSSTINGFHVCNLLRTNYESAPDIEVDITIDTTYKQFLTTAYTEGDIINYDDMAAELPEVLVYEYGNYEQLYEQLSALETRFGEEKAKVLCNEVYKNNCYFKYQISDLQHLEGYEVMNYSSEFIEDLRSNNGKLSVKLDDTLVLNSINSDLKKEFVYDTNGVYRCYLENTQIKEFATGFTIINQNSDHLYGASDGETELFATVNGIFTSDNYLRLLDRKSTKPMTINMNNLFGSALMCIDFGSGVETPSIYIIPLTATYSYGDVNMDGVVNVIDVTYLQKSIAHYEGFELDVKQKSIADVTKTEALNVINTTAISKKIALLEDFEYGDKLYFSQYLCLGFMQNGGYIDF